MDKLSIMILETKLDPLERQIMANRITFWIIILILNLIFDLITFYDFEKHFGFSINTKRLKRAKNIFKKVLTE